MAEASVRWTGGKTFIGVDSTQHAVVMSSTAEGIGMKASELLLVALATCSAYDVVTILEKKKIALRKLTIKVNAEQRSDPPWPFTHIHLTYILAGDGLGEVDARKAIELSESKYCSVAATVKGVAEITWDCVLD